MKEQEILKQRIENHFITLFYNGVIDDKTRNKLIALNMYDESNPQLSLLNEQGNDIDYHFKAIRNIEHQLRSKGINKYDTDDSIRSIPLFTTKFCRDGHIVIGRILAPSKENKCQLMIFLPMTLTPNQLDVMNETIESLNDADYTLCQFNGDYYNEVTINELNDTKKLSSK